MSQYTVPQNVEAEDRIIGPLTFKQFVYAMIGFGWGVLVYAIFNKIILLAIVLILPVSGLFELLAFYRRDGQDFEKLLIALVGFLGNSRFRVWRRDDTAHTLKIEPAKVVVEQTQRSPTEVRGELERLSSLIDSRGWNEQQTAAGVQGALAGQSDRLVAPVVPQPAVGEAPQQVEDILDLQNSPLAQNLAGLMQQASEDVKTAAISQMRALAEAPTAQATSGSASGSTLATPQTVSSAEPAGPALIKSAKIIKRPSSAAEKTFLETKPAVKPAVTPTPVAPTTPPIVPSTPAPAPTPEPAPEAEIKKVIAPPPASPTSELDQLLKKVETNVAGIQLPPELPPPTAVPVAPPPPKIIQPTVAPAAPANLPVSALPAANIPTDVPGAGSPSPQSLQDILTSEAAEAAQRAEQAANGVAQPGQVINPTQSGPTTPPPTTG